MTTGSVLRPTGAERAILRRNHCVLIDSNVHGFTVSLVTACLLLNLGLL